MAIVQISKIQQRSGNLVDLPQLDQAEFGWASDQNRLFIGKNIPGADIENIEVLTSYSEIEFSQINGAVGNLDITNPVTGQTFAYDGGNSTWINTGGNALDPGNTSYWSNTPIHLGNVSNVFIGGGADGYVLETDGTGNLSWTPKGTLYTVIEALSNTNPMIMTVDETTPYTNGQEITISGCDLTGVDVVNGNVFYVKVAVDFPTSGNVSLYTDSALVNPADGTTIGTYTANSGIATAVIASPTLIIAAGANTQIQYNSSGILAASPNFTFDFASSVLNVNGNANVGNLNASGILKSSIATGTPPLTVNSTTLVANLNVANAGHACTANTVTNSAQSNITSVGTLIGLTSTGTINFTGASNVSLGAVGNVKITGGSANQILKTDGAGNLSWTDPNGGYYLHTQTVAGSTWTVIHNLNRQYVTVEPVDSNGNSYNGRYDYPVINFTNANALTLTFNSSVAGWAAVTGGGTNINSVLTGNSTPGGVNTQVQFNDAGALAGSSGLLYDKTTGKLTATILQSSTITTGASGTSGTITGNWTLTSGSRLEATYADLAEYYNADQQYEPGTVLEFGGENEVTIALDGTARVAGVVSTDPAYAMNAKCLGQYPTPIALQGRVPCKVRGTIRKGDMMISGGNGYARPSNYPLMGTVIGKALEDFAGTGVIEIAVGRL